MILFPGLIDPHVHLRDPGQSIKEDFYTGTAAALAGGYTTIIDMPNNTVPITSLKRLKEKVDIAQDKIVCDMGFYFGSLGENLSQFEKIQKNIIGLKVYLNATTGNYVVNEDVFKKICNAWPNSRAGGKPILVHAEENILEKIIDIASKHDQRLHVCHISSQNELQFIIDAKNRGVKITCGVTPHHLFLTVEDEKRLGPFGKMKPVLKSKKDVNFLWKNLNVVDVVESDHAPHTFEEKQSDNPPFGVPGLETTLPLLLTAASENRISYKEIIRLCHTNSLKIFSLPRDDTTYVEVAEDEEWVIDNKKLMTKCKWSPFHGQKVKGKVKRVFIRGQKVFEDGKILVKPGFGKILP